MRTNRVLLIALDGYDASLGERLADEGLMPALARLRARAARFDLEHGDARWTGLAGEHLSSGLSPAAAGRFSSVHFDTATYSARSAATTLVPFPAQAPFRTVVFNPTYFDLDRAPDVRGMVSWGGVHDPGTRSFARPKGLGEEAAARFGLDPGRDWTYAIVWPSAERTRRMAAALAEALSFKARAARWLLAERLPDWDLGFVSVGEIHSALEAMWHGVDPTHPLHGHESAVAAGDGLRKIYRVADELIGSFAEAFPDTTLVVTSLHGMGPNVSDIAGTALLPELIYRAEIGGRRLEGAPGAQAMATLDEEGEWYGALRRRFESTAPRPAGLWRRLAARLAGGGGAVDSGDGELLSGDPSLDWMPAIWYRRHWRSMRAFALPGYYDGRIRINLAGRERSGIVAPGDYDGECARIAALLGECRDTRTGAPVIAKLEIAPAETAPGRAPTAVDIVARWNGVPVGFDHPRLGRIGPLPFRRTGGHTGGHGVAYVAGGGIAPGARGLASSFDVVPTVFDLLGAEKPPALTGRSLFAAAR